MRRSIPYPLRPVALLMGILLSAVIVMSDSWLAIDLSLVTLAAGLFALEAPALMADVEDDSE